MAEIFRAGMLLPILTTQAFREGGFVDLTLFTGGITFRMVGAGRVITGPAVGDANGNLTYTWVEGDLTVGTYEAVFIAVDGAGKDEAFPTGTNLQIVVIPVP